MDNGLSLADRFFVVGRMLQVQPTSSTLEAFSRVYPEIEVDAPPVVEQDYLRLFVGLGTPLAPPWESAWASDARLVFQRETLDVRYWYRSYGLEVAALHREPDDHIGYELEFIGTLLERGEQQVAARFAAEHPAAWIARWRDAVQQAAKGSFYPALAAEAERLVASV